MRLYKIICDDPERVGKFVAEINKTEGWSPYAAIGLERKGELVAGIVYDNFNGTNIFAHIAAKGKSWLNREFLWYMCHYPFNELRVNRVSGLIPASNSEVIKFVEHLGARLEAPLKDAHPTGDILIYCLFKKDCKYLRGK